MQRVDTVFEPLRIWIAQASAWLPRLLLALVVLLVGWLIAKAVRFAVVKALRAVNLQVVTERSGIDGFLAQGGASEGAIGLFGALAWWLVVLGAAVVASNTLGLDYVSGLLTSVILFVPKLLVALVIVVFGAYFARFVGNAVIGHWSELGVGDATLLGHLARTAVLVFVALIALDQLEIGGNIVRQSFLVVLGGLVLALALAFGLGARERAALLIERWWPRRDDGELP